LGPPPEVEIDGILDRPFFQLPESEVTLRQDGAAAFEVPVLLTRSTFGVRTSKVRGFASRSFSIGDGPFDSLRFYVLNFPDFNGDPIRYSHEGNFGATRGRLQVTNDAGASTLDQVIEAKNLIEAAKHEPGFVLSHVGSWVPATGSMTIEQAENVLNMLHYWYGFVRGAWCGPVFPQGLRGDQVVWQQFAPWKVDESRIVETWLPTRKPIRLSPTFCGFVNRWNDSVWRQPLISTIAWLVEANASRTAHETRIILGQVALELLAWVHVVESKRLHSRGDFKRLSAAGRIRALLHALSVPVDVPRRLTGLEKLLSNDSFDGPGVITRIRNSLVHASEGERAGTLRLEGIELWECSELTRQYVEMSLLSLFGHNDYFAQRGWRGWKGENEIAVPWSAK
jgi:hypothetical protein